MQLGLFRDASYRNRSGTEMKRSRSRARPTITSSWRLGCSSGTNSSSAPINGLRRVRGRALARFRLGFGACRRKKSKTLLGTPIRARPACTTAGTRRSCAASLRGFQCKRFPNRKPSSNVWCNAFYKFDVSWAVCPVSASARGEEIRNRCPPPPARCASRSTALL
jgi:hypothetical protein